MIHFIFIIRLMILQISIECVDNASGSGGVIVYDNKTVPFSSQQDARGWTASDYSSVQPFQSDHDENEDIAVDCEPAETDSNSLASLQEEEEEDGERMIAEDDC